MPQPWFERQFLFAEPTMHYPVVVERLRGLVPRVHAKIAGQAPENLRMRPDPERWSAQEHIGHLADLELLWLGRLDDFAADAETLRPADMKNRATHDRHHNDRDLNEVVRELEERRAHLLQRVAKLTTADFDRTSRHPRLDQPMRLIDSLLFAAEHDDHHLATITAMFSHPRTDG